MTAPDSKNICAVVVSYNPTNNLLQLAGTLIEQLSSVVVVDNNSWNDGSVGILKQLNAMNVHVICNSENMGIASALNIGIEHAIAADYDWVLQFDQDSSVEEDLVKELCSCCNDYKGNLAMAGVNYIMNGKPLFRERDSSVIYRKVKTLITSGSMLSTEAYRKAGRYRDDFFIDAVDFEYCLRLGAMGYDLIITSKPLMHHHIGNINKGIFGLKSTNHSPLRRYYRARNTMVLTRIYFEKFPTWILKYNVFLLLSVLLIILLEDEKSQKLKAIARGWKEGIRMK